MSEQKKNKQKIEDLISDFLNGDMKTNALQFIAWLREHKITITKNSEGAYTFKIMGKSSGRIFIAKDNFVVEPYVNYKNKEVDVLIENFGMQDVIWDSLFFCRRCAPHNCASKTNESKDDFIGFKRIVFGKQFNNLCQSEGIRYKYPDEKTIDFIKTIIEFEQASK